MALRATLMLSPLPIDSPLRLPAFGEHGDVGRWVSGVNAGHLVNIYDALPYGLPPVLLSLHSPIMPPST